MGVSRKLQAQLEGHFTKIARVFARNHKINVVLAGTSAYTTADGTIRLPGNADYFKDEDAKLLGGILDHEWSHQAEESEARETPGYPSPLAIMGECKTKREKLMVNVLEDIRIEIKQGGKYIGVAHNLEAAHKHTVEVLCKPKMLGVPDKRTGKVDRIDPWWALGVTIIGTARGWDMAWLPSQWKDMAKFLAPEIEESRTTTNAREVKALALRILEKLKELSEEPTEDSDMGEGEEGKGDAAEGEEGEGEAGEGEGSPSDEDGDSEGKGGSGGDEDAEGEGEGAEDSDATATKAEMGAGKGGRGGADIKEIVKVTAKVLTGDDARSEDITDELRKDIKMRAEYDIKVNDRHVSHPAAVAADKWEKVKAGHDAVYLECLEKVRPSISALRAKIMTVLQSRRARRYEGDQERGGIDAGALYGLRLGNKRVFTKRVQDTDVSTVVGIVVDQSGSMGDGQREGNKAYMAKLACIALAECLHKVGIPFAVWGFDNSGTRAYGDEDGLYNRFEPLNLQVYKQFDQPFTSGTRSSLTRISGHGNNTDGDALQYFAREMAHRPEQRKILMVLSDGMPCAACRDGNLLGKHLNEVVLQTIAAGIEVFGIGIMTDCVKQFYPDWCAVHNLDDLAPQTFRMLKKYLLSKKPTGPVAKLPARR